MGVYTFVFQFVLPTTVPGVPYPVFFLTGVLAWNLFSVGSLMAGVSLLDGNTLVKKAAFPHITLPVSAVLASGVNYLATVPILIIFNVWFGIVPGLSLVLFPLLLVLLLVVAAAVGLLLAALIPRFRDLQHLVEILFMCWFLLTPVLYPMSQIESRLSAVQLIIYSLNPMVGVMNLVHAVFLGQPVSAIPMLVSGFGILVMFSLGLWVFHRLKDSLAEL
jgi:ABC-type polysaccharide/polyol phosphate export permease